MPPRSTKPKRLRPPGEEAMMAVRAQQALDLRIAGATYRQIATQLACSVKTAYHDVQGALDEIAALSAKKAERVRDLEVARLDRLNVALAAGIKAGQPGAIFAAVKIMERRAKLLGLDADTAVSVSGGLVFSWQDAK